MKPRKGGPTRILSIRIKHEHERKAEALVALRNEQAGGGLPLGLPWLFGKLIDEEAARVGLVLPEANGHPVIATVTKYAGPVSIALGVPAPEPEPWTEERLAHLHERYDRARELYDQTVIAAASGLPSWQLSAFGLHGRRLPPAVADQLERALETLLASDHQPEGTP